MFSTTYCGYPKISLTCGVNGTTFLYNYNRLFLEFTYQFSERVRLLIEYIEIIELYPDGDIKEYKTAEVFEDEDELARWFAYDYNSSRHHSRYQIFLDWQWLCRQDVFRDDNDYCHPRNLAIVEEYGETDKNGTTKIRILNIRNYTELIEKYHHCGNTLYRTKKDLAAYYERRDHRRNGRAHRKHWGSFRHSNLAKRSLVVKYTGTDWDIEDNEDIAGCKILCRLPKENVSRERSNLWDERWVSIRNNWKQRKVRHQWQWHKPHTGGKRTNNISFCTSKEDFDECA